MKANIIRQLSDFFSTQPIEKAWIFGSYARGDETAESDLDIMVSYIPGECPGILGICRIVDSLQNLLGIKVDLVESGTLYPRVEKEVEKQKIPIYERGVERPFAS